MKQKCQEKPLTIQFARSFQAVLLAMTVSFAEGPREPKQAHRLLVYDVKKGKLQLNQRVPSSKITNTHLSPNGSYVVIKTEAEGFGDLGATDAASGHRLIRVSDGRELGHLGTGTFLGFSGDERSAIVYQNKGTEAEAVIWALPDPKLAPAGK